MVEDLSRLGRESRGLQASEESEAIELLKRIYYFAKRIAKTVGRITDEPAA